MSLPNDIKHKDEILQMSFGLASPLNEKLYEKELRRLSEHSSSKDSKEFLLIDYYFCREEYKKAVESIDVFEKSMLRMVLLICSAQIYTI